MKLEKMLPVFLLVGGAICLLSGCDQLLDAVYNPSNQITAEVAVNTATHPDFTWGFVNMQLSGPNLSAVERVAYSSSDSQYAYYYFTFMRLPDGTYDIAATYFGRSSPSSSGYVNNITLPAINPSNPSNPGRSVSIPPIHLN